MDEREKLGKGEGVENIELSTRRRFLAGFAGAIGSVAATIAVEKNEPQLEKLVSGLKEVDVESDEAPQKIAEILQGHSELLAEIKKRVSVRLGEVISTFDTALDGANYLLTLKDGGHIENIETHIVNLEQVQHSFGSKLENNTELNIQQNEYLEKLLSRQDNEIADLKTKIENIREENVGLREKLAACNGAREALGNIVSQLGK